MGFVIIAFALGLLAATVLSIRAPSAFAKLVSLVNKIPVIGVKPKAVAVTAAVAGDVTNAAPPAPPAA